MAHLDLFSCATNIRIGMEVALYKDIHGFGQIFRQTGPVAPCNHWMLYELPRHKQPNECSFGANEASPTL